LRSSEEKFRLAFDTSPDSIAITRLKDGKFVSVNKGFENITGYSQKEIIGKTSAEINIWKNPEDRRKMVEGLQANSQVQNYETPFLTRRGEIYGMMSAVIIELNGEPHILNITRDITERKQAEEKLAFQASLLEQVHNGVIALDLDNKILFWNKFAEELYQWTSAEAVGKNIIELLAPEEMKDTVRRNFANLNRDGHWEGDFNVKRKDGNLLPAHITNTYLKDLAGNNVGFIGISADITERKQADEKLHESEERFRRAVLGAPFPILIHAEDGEVVTVNTPWSKLTGYEHSDIPTIAEWTQKAYGTRMELVRADIDKLYALDGPKAEGEYTIMTRSGQARIWDFSSAPIGQLPDGRRLVISMAMDITERKQAEDQIKEQLEELLRWQNAILGREDRVLDLKREVNDLLKKDGLPPRYESAK
jgi:PAS domain S-box-containing protein